MHNRIPPPVIGLAAAALIWLLAGWVPALAISFPGQTVLALVIAALGAMLDIVSIGQFFKKKTTVNPLTPHKAETLVISGLYRITRNPMYLGLAFLLTAWMIHLGNPAGILVLAAFFWFLTEFQIKPEETVLRERFGSEYDAYMRSVRRWI